MPQCDRGKSQGEACANDKQKCAANQAVPAMPAGRTAPENFELVEDRTAFGGRATYRNPLGADNDDLAMTLGNLGTAYESIGQYADAEKFQLRALGWRVPVVHRG